MLSLSELAAKFDPQTLRPDPDWIYTWSRIRTRDEPVAAEQYLKFAENDLATGDSAHHLVNALTNAKRALHLRMEDMCLGFGFESYSRARPFPKMVEYVSRVGVTAPRILRRMNEIRNRVEHEYVVPSASEVETFIDVTCLFIASTQRWINRQPCDVEMRQEVAIEGTPIVLVSMTFSWEKGKVVLHFVDPMNVRDTAAIEFQCPSPEFFTCARLALQNDW